MTPPAWVALAAAACLLIGLGLGRWSVEQESAQNNSPVAMTAAEKAPAERPALIQVAEDWDHAEFVVEGVAPRFLMDALLFAGHSIALEQRIAAEGDAVNIMRINKFGQLLAEQAAP